VNGPCVICAAPDSYYDKIVVDGKDATLVLTLKHGRICGPCRDTLRADVPKFLNNLPALRPQED
jgi:alpha-D-ribose 1-methylphosphonate 5-phosphate C-P lyase